MDEQTWLTSRFEEHRPHLRSVAYRMLGSLSAADDAVQETWLRMNRADTSDVENLRAWLTTVVGRVCLNMLRSRTTHREDPIDAEGDVHLPDPIVTGPDAVEPEQAALLADSVGLALLVVLETLGPAERLAFVLHDIFGVPFDEVATIVDRSPEAARQLASRARRRIQGGAPAPDADLARQREVVDAFFAAARAGDFEGLVALLDPDVVTRSDGGPTLPEITTIVRGAALVAGRAITYARPGSIPHPALVNGAAGVVIVADGRPIAVMGFTVVGGRIAAIDALADPERVARLDLSFLDA